MIPSTALRVVSNDSTHLIATADRVAVLWWRGAVTVTQVLTGCSMLRDLVARHPQHAVVLVVIDDACPVPDEPVRQAMAQLMREGVRGVRAVAVVGEGGVFHQTAVRGVVTGLTLVVKVPFLLKVFSSVDEACVWFGSVTPGPPMRSLATEAREKLFGASVRPPK
ncbi:MAG: hypothetical protein JNK05_05090 [Myxococcales bacterium]|nr:hypothetical protein [Myxococcales bacterium]